MDTRRKQSEFISTSDILKRFNPTNDKYVSREFQKYGYDLAQELGDSKHISLYIKLAKTYPRGLIEQARYFVKDANNVKNRPALFIWKLTQLRKETKKSKQ